MMIFLFFLPQSLCTQAHAKKQKTRRMFQVRMGWAWEGISAKRRLWRIQQAEIEEAAGELPANAGKATVAATVGKWESPPNVFDLSAALPRLQNKRDSLLAVSFILELVV